MSIHNEKPISVRVAALLVGEALRRGVLARDRGAIVSRLESLAEGILSGGGNIFAVAFFGRDGFEKAAGDEGTATLRRIGDAFWAARLSGKDERRREGSFYTPDPVIDRILDLVWKDMFPGGTARPGEKTVCDPALGCGFFFLRLVETLRNRKVSLAKIRRWAADSLFGVDVDAQAVFVAKALLWLALSDGKKEFVPDAAHFVVGDSLLGPAFDQAAQGDAGRGAGNGAGGLDWGAAFPLAAAQGGFDVVLGNPPYEVLTNFARHPEQRALADALRNCGLYQDSLSGQINLYRCFIERGLDLLKPRGALSYVVPLSLARDGAAAALRGRLLEREAAAQWFLYGEKERLFTGVGVTQSACVFRAVRGGGGVKSVSITVGGRGSRIPVAELRRGGGDLALPGLDARGLKLWRWLYRNCTGRLSDVAEARVGEVDQTLYRECMLDRVPDGAEGAGTILVRGAHLSPFRLDVEAREGKERFLDLPRFLAMKGGAAEACRARAGEWRVAQLGIRNMQSRPRLVAGLIPPGVYAGNSLNVYRVFAGVDIHFVAGVLNSCWLDWLFRVGSGNNNINLREMLALPFPSGAAPALRARVAERYRGCERVALQGGGLEEARGELDGAVGECYGVEGDMKNFLEKMR